MESELFRCACCRIWKMARSVHILRHILQNGLAARRSLPQKHRTTNEFPLLENATRIIFPNCPTRRRSSRYYSDLESDRTFYILGVECSNNVVHSHNTVGLVLFTT
jgi:hypothetical protein